LETGDTSAQPATADNTAQPDATKPVAPQPAAQNPDQPMDLFEMAAKNSADKKAAAEKQEAEMVEPSEKDPPPPPEMLTLPTDGINIKAAFFPSPNADTPDLAKVISPIILLHDWGGSMNDMGSLAQYLQGIGHTVIVPDLRGHGGSVSMQDSPVEIDYEDFNRIQIATIKRDFEACKKELIKINNEGKLNINMLSVVAVGDMCTLATEWTLTDWSYRNIGRIKQGQDIQSLVLVSPPKKFQQSTMGKLIRHPLLAGGGNFALPTLVIYGEDSASAKDVQTIYRAMERKRPPSEQSDAKLRWAEQNLFELPLPSDGEGAELLASSPEVFRFIGRFNFYKISKNADRFKWSSRGKKKK